MLTTACVIQNGNGLKHCCFIMDYFGVILNTGVSQNLNIFTQGQTLKIHISFLFLINAVLCLVAQSCPTLCDPMDCSPPDSSVHGDSPDKNTGVGCHVLLEIFPTQGSNPGLAHCRQILYQLSYQGSPVNATVFHFKTRELHLLGKCQVFNNEVGKYHLSSLYGARLKAELWWELN